jgi:N-methylhydantoinase A/oxoprolinase/acetone carboxylase beta subunit
MTGGLRIGIDVGGTNTDAALVDGNGTVVAWTKTPTTDDPGDGIERALGAVLPDDRAAVELVALGTTHALNAVVSRRDLGRVLTLRVAAPSSRSVPPMTGWPADLKAVVDGGAAIVHGGVEVDGRVHPIDRDEIRHAVDGRDVSAVAIGGPFSLQDPSQELEVADLVRDVVGPDVPIATSHRIGGLGLLERENGTILNAALRDVVAGVVEGFAAALAAHGVTATPFLTQNDGTLMRLEHALEMPALTIGSGAANSIRGAAALTGLTDAHVIDVGGTTTDVGVIKAGFPRVAAVGVVLGGVRTNFRMPDVHSIGVGGGTRLTPEVSLDTTSVGRSLTSDALVFGGDIPTLSDAAVAAGRVRMGDARRLDGRAWPGAIAEADRRVADALDRMKTSREPVEVLLVGGGSSLFGDTLPGASTVHRPDRYDVANAIGAAIALVSGEAEVVAEVADGRDEAIERCIDAARARAIAAGADRGALEVVAVDETPLAYMDRPMSQLRAKVVGAPAERPSPSRRLDG